MRLNITSPLRTLGAVTIGMACGYLLWVQILTLPEEWSNSLRHLAMSLIKSTVSFLSIELPYDVKLALVSFFPVLPNTFVVAVIAALALRFVGRERPFIYSVLIWPTVLHLFHWFYVWYIERVAIGVGANPNLTSYKENYFYPSKAVSIALIYSLFLVLMFLLSQIPRRKTHNPSVNTDAAR